MISLDNLKILFETFYKFNIAFNHVRIPFRVRTGTIIAF